MNRQRHAPLSRYLQRQTDRRQRANAPTLSTVAATAALPLLYLIDAEKEWFGVSGGACLWDLSAFAMIPTA